MRLKLLLIMCTLLGSLTAAQAQKKYGELWGQRASLFGELPICSTDIVMLGNSLTHGCEWHELMGMPNIKNRGINGDIVQGLRDRVEPIVQGKPAKLFILSGVNDISHNVTPDSIARVMGELIEYVQTQSPKTEIYLQSLLPINNSFGRYKAIFGKEDDVRQTNVLLQQVAQERGVTFINLYPLFEDAEGNLRAELTNDGLHLLAPGYMIWREALLPYMK